MARGLTIDIFSDFHGKGFREAESQVSGVSGAFKSLGKAAIAAGAVGAVAAGLKTVVTAASDLQQSVGAIESTFGGATDQIKDFGATAASSIGISQAEFQNLAAVSGSMLKNLGFSSQQAADATKQLATRASDVAAVFGGKTSDALEAMNAALRGEYDSLEKYGIKLTAADIKARAMADGLTDATGEITKQGQATAALSLIMDQSADKAGQFASESKTFAGATQILKAKFTDLAARLGQAVLPLVTKLIDLFSTYLMPVIDQGCGLVRVAR